MKRFSTRELGVTLLEIMLVLAIAAMVIVMSVRYYQSATASQQANSALAQIQAITAAADGLAQGAGSYATVSTTTVQPLMPNNSMSTIWGGDITITNGTTNSYTVTFDTIPGNVCSQLAPKLKANTKFTADPATCPAPGTTGSFSYTYDSQL